MSDLFDRKQNFHIGLSSKNSRYNRTIIWLTIIFFVISIILSAIFVYLPVHRIEKKIDDTINKDQKRFEKIDTFIDKLEPDVELLIRDAKNLVRDLCKSPFASDLKELCITPDVPINPLNPSPVILTQGVAILIPPSTSTSIPILS